MYGVFNSCLSVDGLCDVGVGVVVGVEVLHVNKSGISYVNSCHTLRPSLAILLASPSLPWPPPSPNGTCDQFSMQ